MASTFGNLAQWLSKMIKSLMGHVIQSVDLNEVWLMNKFTGIVTTILFATIILLPGKTLRC